MPLPMVHLAVAEKLTSALEITDYGSFWLGAIAPDAVHMREDFHSEYKLASHLRDSVEMPKETVLERAIQMIRTADDGDNRDFCIGYGVHVATDMIWNRTIFADFKQKYQEAGFPADEQKSVYYNDTDQLDFVLFERLPWRRRVWQELMRCESIGLNPLVSADEAERWKQRTLHWYDSGESQHKNPIWFFTYEKLLDFAENTSEKILILTK